MNILLVIGDKAGSNLMIYKSNIGADVLDLKRKEYATVTQYTNEDVIIIYKNSTLNISLRKIIRSQS